jgi:hypothetical protein
MFFDVCGFSRGESLKGADLQKAQVCANGYDRLTKWQTQSLGKSLRPLLFPLSLL